MIMGYDAFMEDSNPMGAAPDMSAAFTASASPASATESVDMAATVEMNNPLPKGYQVTDPRGMRKG
jgi:hypothetical protein